MNKFSEKEVVGLSGVGLGLDELVRHGARQVANRFQRNLMNRNALARPLKQHAVSLVRGGPTGVRINSAGVSARITYAN